LREWDGEFVVRNEQTGSSHLLGPLAGRVLGILLETDDRLEVAEIAARLGAAGTSEAPGAIDEVLAEFRRLGLAESGPT
jgi:PqqD family protein of HPr-rel-A system